VTNNSAGGQPVSIQNLRETAEVCRRYGIPLDLDAARYAENAYFIKRDEPGYRDKSIKEIIREMFSHADMFTMSAKKDAIVNMGGLIGVKNPDSDKILEIKASCIEYEGFYTYGGLNGRDMEVIAIGMQEGIDENYLAYRIGQQEYLAARLDDADIAYQAPVGGHGVFLDARAMFPAIPYDQFPGQTLAVELYKEAGIRSCDIGSYMLGNDPDTGKQLKADFEFTRLAMPRRVYTQAHLDMIAEACIAIKERAASIAKGYRITWEPPILRHFQAMLAPVE
jgi:tryptophanase